MVRHTFNYLPFDSWWFAFWLTLHLLSLISWEYSDLQVFFCWFKKVPFLYLVLCKQARSQLKNNKQNSQSYLVNVQWKAGTRVIFFKDYFVGFIVVLHTLNPVFKFLIWTRKKPGNSERKGGWDLKLKSLKDYISFFFKTARKPYQRITRDVSKELFIEIWKNWLFWNLPPKKSLSTN